MRRRPVWEVRSALAGGQPFILEVAGFDAGDIEDVGDKLAQPMGVGGNAAQKAAHTVAIILGRRGG